MQIAACAECEYKTDRAYNRKWETWQFALKSGFLNKTSKQFAGRDKSQPNDLYTQVTKAAPMKTAMCQQNLFVSHWKFDFISSERARKKEERHLHITICERWDLQTKQVTVSYFCLRVLLKLSNGLIIANQPIWIAAMCWVKWTKSKI